MNAEGALSVRLATAGGRVASVEVTSTRPRTPRSLFSGKGAVDVARLVPLLFPICGMAHSVAFARACESAFGIPTRAPMQAARDLLCQAEAVASHVWQLAIPWQEAAAMPPDLVSVRAAREALVGLSAVLFGSANTVSTLRPEPSLVDAGAIVETLASLLERLLRAECPLMAEVTRQGRSSFGSVATRTIAELDVAAVGRLLSRDPLFANHADVEGEPVDVSAYARTARCEEVVAVEARYGRGLLARLVARRADARAAAARLRLSLADLESAGRSASSPERSGVGEAHTARGPLVYWVQGSAESIDDVRMVSPTDWTFHPRGVLPGALRGAPATTTLERDAGWLVLALDPCVPCKVEVRDA